MAVRVPTAPTLNHVGITVPEIDKAIEWYCGVLGLNLIGGPLQVGKDDEPFGEVLSDIFGPEWGDLKVAFLSGPDGVGIELFQFVLPATVQPQQVEYWRTGPFHICLTWPDATALAEHIAEHGGRRRSKVWTLFPGRDVVYCEDPFGNLLEISSASFERTWANRGSDANE